MNKTLGTILTVLVVLVLTGAIFFAGSMYARANSFGSSITLAPGASADVYGWDNNQAFGPSMMNGRGPGMMNGYGYNSARDVSKQKKSISPKIDLVSTI